MVYLDGIIYKIQRYGGITTYFNEIERGLTKYDFNYYVLKYDLEKEKNPNTLNVRSRFLERYLPIKGIPDNSLFHTSYYRFSSNKKVKNIITLYDFTYEKYSKNPQKTIHIFQKKKALNKADLIFCISENTKNDLLYYYPSVKNKIIIVTHLAASASYKNLSIPFEFRNNNPKVLFVGARSGYKNFFEVVKALEQKKEFFLQIIGGGLLSLEEKSFLNKHLFGRYEQLLNLDNDELNILYNHAFCLIYPSLYEGFGIPVLEAMSANCPVIASNISSIPEIAGNSAILLDKSEKEEIIQAINDLSISKNYEKVSNLGILNSKNFSWDKTVEMTIAGYNSIM